MSSCNVLGCRELLGVPHTELESNKLADLLLAFALGEKSIIEHVPYPRSLRFSEIVKFQKALEQKSVATYEKAQADPNHSTFLKSFGGFRTDAGILIGQVRKVKVGAAGIVHRLTS